MSEDAFEKLFSLLEEDLKNEGFSGDDFDDEIAEEELEKLERELAAALAGDDDDEDNEEEKDDDSGSPKAPLSADSDFSDEDSEDEEDLSLPKLKNWQLRRLASALQIGRRKTNIKALSAELGLERAVVLQFLREPPPNLLLVAATLPEKKAADERLPELVEEDAAEEVAAPPPDSPAGSEPVRVMKARWSASKRMKKVQLETLERVYTRTRRPTNSMISSIVHTTNLPRKKVVQWFEDKRVEDGEPERRRAFHRSDQDSVFS